MSVSHSSTPCVERTPSARASGGHRSERGGAGALVDRDRVPGQVAEPHASGAGPGCGRWPRRRTARSARSARCRSGRRRAAGGSPRRRPCRRSSPAVGVLTWTNTSGRPRVRGRPPLLHPAGVLAERRPRVADPQLGAGLLDAAAAGGPPRRGPAGRARPPGRRCAVSAHVPGGALQQPGPEGAPPGPRPSRDTAAWDTPQPIGRVGEAFRRRRPRRACAGGAAAHPYAERINPARDAFPRMPPGADARIMTITAAPPAPPRGPGAPSPPVSRP